MSNNTTTQSHEIIQIISELAELKAQNTELPNSGYKLNTVQKKLHSLLHSASDGIITFTKDGKVENFNLAAQQVFGFSEGEVVNRKIADLIPCPDWVENNVGAFLRYFISSRASEDTPLLGKHQMGFDILLHVSAAGAHHEQVVLFDSDNIDSSPVKNDTQPIIYFFRDITLNKKIEKELADHKYALDLAASTLTRDSDFRVINANENFCKMLGKSRSEVIGTQFILAKKNDQDTNHLQQKRDLLAKGNPWVGETYFLNNLGEKIWFEESSTPFLDKNNVPYQYLSILNNITDRKRAETLLQQHSNNLQELVDDQIKDIKQARDAAENANKAKSEFLANMSHELRTPMHAIISFTHLCLKQLKALSVNDHKTVKIQKFLTNIETSSQRLLHLLNNLLDLSKLEAGKEEFTLKKNDLFLLSHQICDEYSAKAHEKSIKLIINQATIPTLVLCDKNKILQVLSNLIANAIKFSDESKSIIIALTLDSVVLGKRKSDTQKTQGVLLSVTDQGIGIPESELASIFDKFIQSSHSKSGAGGTGLGLSISHEIISFHKGKIWAEQNPSGGSIFKFFLPLSPVFHAKD